MLCPEGDVNVVENTDQCKEIKEVTTSHSGLKMLAEVPQSLEFNTYKSPRTWKKSLSNFFRNQMRSSKSNDGDRSADNSDDYMKRHNIPREQKWQSLGKVFRRSSVAENCTKSQDQYGECSTQNKKVSVKKVISSYFGKNLKSHAKDQSSPEE